MEAKSTNSKTLVDQVYTQIKEDIIEGFLKAGEKIQLNQLITRYSVSETPIKQALNRLTAEGLVVSMPRQGMKVKRFTGPEIEEILDIRLMIEIHNLNKVIIALDSDMKLKKMFEKNLEDHYEYVKNFSTVYEYLNVYNLDQEFHELCIRCTGNKKLLSVYKSLNSHAYATYLYGKQPREKTFAGVKEHKEIYEALISRDEEKARNAIILHNRNAKEIIMLMLKIGEGYDKE